MNEDRWARQRRYRARKRGEHTPYVATSAVQPTDDVAAIRAMSADAFAAYLLERGLYVVESETGTIANGRTGRVLKPILNPRTGYYSVGLSYKPIRQSMVYVHRLIALAVWGAAAIKDREVAHLDDNPSHNVAANLKPLTVYEHRHRDLYDRGRHYGGAKPKASWEPCARCGDPDGKIRGASRTPIRVSGVRFGIDGQICLRCYHLLHARVPDHLRQRKVRRDAQPLLLRTPETGVNNN